MAITPLQATEVANAAALNSRLAAIETLILAGYVPPVGFVVMYSGGIAPSGWLLCDGAAVSRATYAALFAAIGTSYGAGDGSATFNLPDLRSRTPIGAGTGAGLSARTLGQQVGAETHQLSVAELAAHTHRLKKTGTTANTTAGAAAEAWNPGAFGATTNSIGSNTPHNNMQPSLGLNFIVKS